MIEKNLIKKILRSVLRRSQGLGDHHIMHPIREWFFGLAVALIILSISVFFCVKLYLYYSTLGPSSGTGEETAVVIYRADEVDKALNEFNERRKLHNDIKENLTSKISVPEPVTAPNEAEIPPEIFPSDPTPTLPPLDNINSEEVISQNGDNTPPVLEAI